MKQKNGLKKIKNTMHNTTYSLWRVNGYKQGFRSVAKFASGGQESAPKPPQAICKRLWSMIMENYYKILNLNSKASQKKIFKKFRRLIISENNNSEQTKSFLKAYFVLQEDSKKFYDLIIIKRIEKKKYIDVVNRKEKRANQFYENYLNDNSLINKPLKSFPLTNAFIEFIGFLLEVEIGWTTIGLLSTLTGIGMLIYGIVKSAFIFIYVGVPLLVIGILFLVTIYYLGQSKKLGGS